MEASSSKRTRTLTQSALKISKEVQTNVVENDVISKIRKLPQISLVVDLTKSSSKLEFKVPEVPKLKKNNLKKNNVPGSKSKFMFEKRILLKKQNEMMSSKNLNWYNTVKNRINVQKNSESKKIKTDVNNILLTKKNSDNIISANHEATFKNYSNSEKKIQRQRLIKNNLKKKLRFSLQTTSINVENVKPVEEILKSSTVSHDVNEVPDNNSAINNAKMKNNKLNFKYTDEDYTLLDISTKGKFYVFPTSPNFKEIDLYTNIHKLVIN